jgi:hypothetical protein
MSRSQTSWFSLLTGQEFFPPCDELHSCPVGKHNAVQHHKPAHRAHKLTLPEAVHSCLSFTYSRGHPCGWHVGAETCRSRLVINTLTKPSAQCWFSVRNIHLSMFGCSPFHCPFHTVCVCSFCCFMNVLKLRYTNPGRLNFVGWLLPSLLTPWSRVLLEKLTSLCS